MASIHQDLTQDDISSVFEAFGGITSCELAMTSVPNRHKGYCFIEYGTSQAATGKKHALKKYDQFALNTSCFLGICANSRNFWFKKVKKIILLLLLKRKFREIEQL